MRRQLIRMWRRTAYMFKAAAMRFSGQGGGDTSLASVFRFGRSLYDYPTDVAGGRGNSVVMSVIGWIIRNFPQADLQVVEPNEDGTFNIQPVHELLFSVKRPNPFYSDITLWAATILDLMTTGNAYWLVAKGKYNTLGELWWIPQQLMRPRWKENGSTFIDWYDYTPDPSRTDQVYKIPFEDIVHFRDGMDPENNRLGLSKLASLMREIWTDDEAANFSASLLRNHALPSVVIAPANDDGEITDEDAEAIKIKYIQNFSNDNRGAPMVISSNVKVQPITFNPQEMNLVGLRRLPEERVTAVYGVNAIVAGLGVGLEHSTFRNYKEARAAAYEECILPLQQVIAAELRRSLLPLFGESDTLDIRFDVSRLSIFQEDMANRARTANMLVTGGWIMVGQGMRMIGLPAGTEHDYYLRKTGTNAVPLAGANKPPKIPDPLKPDIIDLPGKEKPALPAPEKEAVA